MDAPLELIIAVYNDPELAGQVLADMKRLGQEGQFAIKNASVLVKDDKGRVRTDESGDVGPGRGALFGAITGGLIGLLAGPAGAITGALAGAATGGVTAAAVDMGFSNDQLEELQASMPANSSALVVLIEHAWVEKLVNELENQRGKLFRHEVAPDFSDRFRE
jgi:uncharacterized membrane protein